jgi:parvulin-like peptidyl-prolyl isomerase
MEKEGMTFAAFREEIRNEIMMQRLREHEVDSKIQVSDAEVDTFLAAEKAAAADRVEMDLAQILVRIPENASAEQIAARRSRADDVLRQLRTGADFARIAATYSDAPDALKGGAIGWRDPDRLPPLFAGELRKLKPGQVTPAIKSNTGFHILKLVNKRSLADASDKTAIQQTRARHILLKVTPAKAARTEGAPGQQGRQLRRTGAPAVERCLGHQGRRPGLVDAGRHDAGIRERDEQPETGRSVGRGRNTARLPPDPGRRAQERRCVERA